MKNLIKILLGGFAVFMILAVAQRWEYFSTSWFGEAEEAPVLSPAQSKEAVAAVRALLSSSGHLLASGGDERFADRLQAGEALRSEILADAAYLRHNRLSQVSTLVRFQVLETTPLSPERLQVTSREFWVHRLHAAGDDRQVQPTLSQIVQGTYVVGYQGGSWHVLAWDFPPMEDAGGDEAAGDEASAPLPEPS